MSIAIRIGRPGQKNSALFYLNATTRYQRTFKSQVSKYPLDAGVSITDHVVNENPVIQVSGIISPADISIRASNVTIGGESPINSDRFFGDGVEAKIDNLLSGLKKYLPDVATQFLPSTAEKPTGGRVPEDKVPEILEAVNNLFTSLVYDRRTLTYRNSVTLCSLFEMSVSGDFRKEHSNLVLTEFTGRYEPDSGDALLVDMTFEEVRFVNLQETRVPQNVSASISAETAIKSKETVDKGVSNRSPLKQLLEPEENEKKSLMTKLAQQTVGVLPL